MKDKYKALLGGLGLKGLEIELYIVLLSKGQSNGNQLAEELSVDRTVVYRILRNLEQRGLIQSTNEKYNRKYSIGDVNKLLSLSVDNLELAKANYNDVKTFIEQIPMLSLEQVLKSKVRVFRGEESIIKVYQEKNRSGDALLREISNNKVFPKLSHGFWDKEIATRKENKSFLHQLVDKSDDSTNYHRTNGEQFKEVRMFPSDFVMSAGINIYSNKVAFHNNSIADPLSLIIEDKAMADLMKNFFDFVWNRSQVI